MVHQSEDQLFKYATKEDGFGLLKLLKESNANIKEIDFESENLTYNPTELVELDPKIYKTDMILELDHLIVLTEFQSTIVKTIDEKRYRLYTALVDYAKRNNKPLILIVISTAEKTKIKEYKINKDCVFTIPIVSLKDFDGDKIINNIENKIKNNQKITKHEMLNLALAPFMSSKKPLDKQIEKTVKTLDEVRKSMKCSSDFVFGIELLIVEKFIKNERQHKKLTNILRDTMKIIDEWRQEDYENGKQEGKEEEKINTAKNMLKENYTIKQIAKITQLNIESIKQIKAESGK
jgi:vacuolar-type H+-ATPase subunit I/STV1